MISRADVGDGGFQRLAGEEHQRGLHDGESEREERQHDQPEFDRGGAALRAAKPARRASRQQPEQPAALLFRVMLDAHGDGLRARDMLRSKRYGNR